MKNFLLRTVLFAALLASISCSRKNQDVKLSFNLNVPASAENGKVVEVLVFDKRKDKEFIGAKIFGKKEIKISINSDLTQFLRKKISESLVLKGFALGDGGKVLEVHLRGLKYESERGFPVGTSKVGGVIKISVRDASRGYFFTKSYVLSLDSKHFIVSLKSTDSKLVNSLLRELVKEILGDEELLGVLEG